MKADLFPIRFGRLWLVLCLLLALPAGAQAPSGSAGRGPAGLSPSPSVSPVPNMAPARGTPPAPARAPAAAADGTAPGGITATVPSRDVLGSGDAVRITVFRYPDLTTEARLSDQGSITFPMIGEVRLAGLTTDAAAARVAARLRDGKFLNNPQVQVALLQLRSRQVSVLGDVARPGRYPLEDTHTKLTDIIAMAGGLGTLASDTVTVMSSRAGKNVKTEVNIPAIIRGIQAEKNIEVQNGDTIFVPRAPVFYIYGEVQRGGVYKLEDKMTIMQAISLGGGITLRGSDRRLLVRRRAPDGKYSEYSGKLLDTVQPDDVIYVKESLF